MNTITVLNIAVTAGLLYSLSKEPKVFKMISIGMGIGVLFINFFPSMYIGIGMTLFFLFSILLLIALSKTPRLTKFYRLLSISVVSIVGWAFAANFTQWPYELYIILLSMVPTVCVLYFFIKGRLMNIKILSPIIIYVPIGMFLFFE